MEQNKINVLYIDDEADNLVTFKANFREHYTIFTAISAEEGKKILEANEIHVLITDQRMPVQTGVQFLESIIKTKPLTIRMILTGYADLETVIEAINKGQIYKYILKPFDFNDLKSSIDNAADLYIFRKSGNDALIKFRQLFERQNEAIFMMNEEGFLQEMNNYGLNLFQLERINLAKTKLEALFREPDELENMQGKLESKEEVIDFPVKLKSTSKTVIDSLLSVIPVWEEKKLIGYQCMVRDITSQKQMENLITRTIIETQEIERKRLTHNLHDSLGQKLAAIKLINSTLLGHPSLSSSFPTFEKSNKIIDEAVKELRSICFNIMPGELENSGLEAAITKLIHQNSVTGAVSFVVKFSGKIPELSASFELAIFRIVQQFITNSIVHGKASKIDVLFNSSENEIDLTLKDNGCGFDPELAKSATGIGLKSIRDRVISYNGLLEIKSAMNKGTQFHLQFPVIK